LKVTLLANSSLGMFSLTFLGGHKNPLYYLPLEKYSYAISCTAERIDAYSRVDGMLSIYNLYKDKDLGTDGEPELVGYGFYTESDVEDFSNALLIQKRIASSSKRFHRPNYSSSDLEKITQTAMLLFRREEFFVFGASNYGILITATSNEAMDEALSNDI
jgi:hypothetical protein